jgi:hypothetical protein
MWPCAPVCVLCRLADLELEVETPGGVEIRMY